MNPHKTTFEKSSERGPKRKNSNVGILCKKRRTINSGVLRERIRMWEYDVKKGEQ